ncbi:MAG: VOC family protein [Nevskiales bacterium]
MNTVTGLADEFGPVRQLGHVVADIASSMAKWQAQGVGPWLWMRNVRLNCHYEGQPSRPLIDVALSYQGNTQIELIQQHNADPSPYLATIKAGTYGLHHQAHLCADINRQTDDAVAQGYRLVCDIRMMGSRYVYLQASDGAYVELLPASLMMRSMFRRGIAASASWRGAGQPMVVNLRNPATLIASLPGAAKARLSW